MEDDDLSAINGRKMDEMTHCEKIDAAAAYFHSRASACFETLSDD